MTAGIARRLKAEGVSGTITQMAYMPYGDVPKFGLPDNVLVVVAQTGPWSVATAGKLEQEAAHFRAWKEKTGRRVQTWTYPLRRFSRIGVGLRHLQLSQLLCLFQGGVGSGC